MGLKTHTGFSEHLRAVQAPRPSQNQVRDLGLGPDRPSYLGLGMDHTAVHYWYLLCPNQLPIPACSYPLVLPIPAP